MSIKAFKLVQILKTNTICVEARFSPITPISYIIIQRLLDSIFLHKDDTACPAKNFYTYESLIQASKCFPRFGSVGSLSIRKREIAAFLAQISYETIGGWATAPDGPYASWNKLVLRVYLFDKGFLHCLMPLWIS
ncbi:hypothetical protein TanjilG_24522 [Lupinus angustifolius]|uniref:Glycoside hydrolase family 19 catalytic domain-containing protein n=1 Tax=Lupinus angustifolius TaxID=3871 RepID=A0A394D9D3_LUPAN|nr:hypothetical protein TanjilG_24522 [Lupinus angustifolius]